MICEYTYTNLNLKNVAYMIIISAYPRLNTATV